MFSSIKRVLDINLVDIMFLGGNLSSQMISGQEAQVYQQTTNKKINILPNQNVILNRRHNKPSQIPHP